MDPWCFWCAAEMCTHKPAEGSKMIHPAWDNQAKAVTAFQGTMCCAACALDIANILARMTATGLERVGTSFSVPVMPGLTIAPDSARKG